jgi:putative endonuclease
MPREYHFYVYMLQSASRRAVYIGVTNNLHRRVFQHKTHEFEGFTDDYNTIRLVYWEKFGSIGNAIAREKQLKRDAGKKAVADCKDEPPMERPRSRLVRNTRSLDCAARPPCGR